MFLILMLKVQIRVQSHCRPLSEDKFEHVIADNYYHRNHFWFELDHGQTSQLIALLKCLEITPANSVPQNTNRVNASSPSEKMENSSSSFEREENTSSPSEHQYNIAQVVDNV